MPGSSLDCYDVAISIPASVRDLNSFRDWAHSERFPQRGSIAFIRGEIVIDMSLQEIETHGAVKMAFYGDLGMFIRKNNLGDLLPSRTMFVSENADLSNEPDATFCGWETLRNGRVEYREHEHGSGEYVEVVGSPDMVLEVVSHSSFVKDTMKLALSYFEAGIDEYWLVDARGAEIDFRILVRGKSRYRKAPADRDGFVASNVFSRRFRLTRDHEPVGGFQYHLEIRPLRPS
jgi:Uma2 family endonuclease